MASDIDISSNALILIGDEPIASFDDPGAGAQAAANLYPDTKRQFLASHPWTFALKEQTLNQLTATPDDLTNYKFAYQIPTDLIRLWSLMPHSDFTIVGDLIYSNENELLARYVYDVEESAMPPHATKALEYRLASDFALLVTESESKASLYEKKYLQAAASARSIDSQSKPPVAIKDSPFVDARLGGFNTSGRYFY
jgi:hypothetical protein